ncbi:MAG: undecaprenyl-diphosphate phosphatase [Bacilli bacterium]|nr:undecaprenyl-diphosphate phosphatase [Bacilli bacterium]
MDLIKYIFLGFIQGFTEPIPVSSSGHLLIIQKLLGEMNVDFETLSILTNFGSFIAIVFLFRKDIIELIKDFFKYFKNKDKNYYNSYKYCLSIVIGTIPAAIMGVVVVKLKVFDFLENNMKFVGVTLLITALFLYLIKDLKGRRSDEEITYKNALVIGLFQVVALLPGISRSGATIVGGMKEHLKRDVAFKFSFMLYIPITLASMIVGIKDLIETSLSGSLIFFYVVATLVSMVVTYFSTKWFRNLVRDGKLIYFVYYCLVIGTLVILFM